MVRYKNANMLMRYFHILAPLFSLVTAGLAMYLVSAFTAALWWALLITGIALAWSIIEVIAWYVIRKKNMRKERNILFEGAMGQHGGGIWPVRSHPFLNFVPSPSLMVDGVNEQGFRSFGPKEGFQGTRLYLAGDCTAFDGHLPAESSMVRLIEETLDKSSPKQVEVINAGFAHYTSLHSLNRFMIDVQRFKFDVGIFAAGINDVLTFVHSGGEPDPDYATFYQPPKDGRGMPNPLASRHPWLFSRLPCLRLYTYSTLWHTIKQWDRQILLLDSNYTSPDNLEKCYANFHTKYIKANLRAFIAVCALHNVLPVLMTNYYESGDMNEPARKFYAYGIDEANEEIRRTASEDGVLLLDMAKEFPREAGLVENKWAFTPQGNIERARIVTEFLGRHNLLTTSAELAQIAVS